MLAFYRVDPTPCPRMLSIVGRNERFMWKIGFGLQALVPPTTAHFTYDQKFLLSAHVVQKNNKLAVERSFCPGSLRV